MFSWGQLQISREAFQRILACHHVFAPFLHVVNEFGSKIRHEFSKSNTFHVCNHMNTCPTFKFKSNGNALHDYGEIAIGSSTSSDKNIEVTYILQYVERNGRNRGDPWSLRQTGVYQQTTFDSHKSMWIFLQLSQSTKAALKEVLQNQPIYPCGSDSPMALHALLLGVTVHNWGDYIQSLSKQLMCVVRLVSLFQI